MKQPVSSPPAAPVNLLTSFTGQFAIFVSVDVSSSVPAPTHWRVTIHSPHLRSSTVPPPPRLYSSTSSSPKIGCSPTLTCTGCILFSLWSGPTTNNFSAFFFFKKNNSKVYAAFSFKLLVNAFNYSFVSPKKKKKCRILNLHTKFNVFTFLNWH